MNIAIDSQAYTYLISALNGLTEPVDALADQKIALVRTFFHSSTFLVPETVRAEYLRIADPQKLEFHQSWSSQFEDMHTGSAQNLVMQRAQDLFASHRKLADCQIVSECESYGVTVLLSYDRDLRKRLNDLTSVKITTPSDYWNSLGIARGARPITIPAPSNPLGNQTWWVW
jgi:hypothetical protein